jgi:hypothetical protein
LVQINYWFINARRRYLPKIAPTVGKVRYAGQAFSDGKRSGQGNGQRKNTVLQ